MFHELPPNLIALDRSDNFKITNLPSNVIPTHTAESTSGEPGYYRMSITNEGSFYSFMITEHGAVILFEFTMNLNGKLSPAGFDELADALIANGHSSLLPFDDGKPKWMLVWVVPVNTKGGLVEGVPFETRTKEDGTVVHSGRRDWSLYVEQFVGCLDHHTDRPPEYTEFVR
jgi:hypothetical protein